MHLLTRVVVAAQMATIHPVMLALLRRIIHAMPFTPVAAVALMATTHLAKVVWPIEANKQHVS